MSNNVQAIHIKKEAMVKLIKAYLSDDFPENARLIPYDMRPTGAEVPYRCCIYKERAIIKNRIIADMGFPLENYDERTCLSAYAKEAQNRLKINDKNLTVLQAACKGCATNRIYVTDLCQGCVARPCQSSCRFGAVTIKDGRSKIDFEKCKKCQMCIKACPYNAIVKISVPCEDSCPVGAIHKDETGFASIDFEKCISCGKCIAACPFGAIHEKSQIIDILKAIKNGKKVIAMIAPAIIGQFKGNIYQLKTAILKAGFSDVFEVAKGADITTKSEAKEFLERMKRGDKFMTTSCCAGYNQLIKKHLPEIKPFVSDTKTPLYYTAEFVKKNYPDALSVFVSPCVAKRAEGFEDDNVDFVLSVEELLALFITHKIVVAECEETKFDTESSKQARSFCVSGGVAGAVKAALKDEEKAKFLVIDGLNKDSIRQLKKYATTGMCEDCCNMVEVMCCMGGCISGNSTINDNRIAQKEIKELLDNSEDIKKDI